MFKSLLLNFVTGSLGPIQPGITWQCLPCISYDFRPGSPCLPGPATKQCRWGKEWWKPLRSLMFVPTSSSLNFILCFLNDKPLCHNMTIRASSNRHVCLMFSDSGRRASWRSIKNKRRYSRCIFSDLYRNSFHSKNNKHIESLFYSSILMWSRHWQGDAPYNALFYLGRGGFLVLFLFLRTYILIHSWKEGNIFFPLCISSQGCFSACSWVPFFSS